MNERSSIREAFWRLTCRENAILSEWAMGLGRRTALERTAHFFCELKARLDLVRGAERDDYHLPMTQAELSDVLGLSSVHMNRTLRAMLSKNLVRLRSQKLTILDREG